VRIDAGDLGQQGADRQLAVQDRVALVRPEALRVEVVEPQRECAQRQGQDMV
jgi:hypothetical protein